MEDKNTLTIQFGKEGETTLNMHPAHHGQEWNAIRPKKSNGAKLTIQNLSLRFSPKS